MRSRRLLLIATAIFSSLLGGAIVYFAISVPNDLRADALLSQARKDISEGKSEKARETLARVIQQHPRTDAAAAATLALVSLAKKDRDDLALSIGVLRKANEQQSAVISDLLKRVATLEKPPPPPPAPVVKPAPKKPAAKKPTPKRTPTRRRR